MRNRVLAALAVAAVLALVVWLDTLAADRLTGGRLHLPMRIDVVRSVCAPEATRASDTLVTLLEEYGGTGAAACARELHVPSEWVRAASPYPPFLGDYDPESRAPDAASAVVESGDRVVQVTVLSGVADTTPSRFVPSVRGDDSYGNDHHPTYVLIHDSAAVARPRLLFAAWSSREIAGLEGIRETAIVASLLVLELALLGVFAAQFRRARRRR